MLHDLIAMGMELTGSLYNLCLGNEDNGSGSLFVQSDGRPAYSGRVVDLYQALAGVPIIAAWHAFHGSTYPAFRSMSRSGETNAFPVYLTTSIVVGI